MLAFQPGGEIPARSVQVIAPPSRRRGRRLRPVVTTRPAAVEFTWGNRRPGTAGFARWAAAVGERIDERGLGANAGDVNNLVATARRLGVATVAADVLADSSQPEPARLRAFAHVVSALVTSPAPIAS